MLEFSSSLIVFTFVALCRLFILTASIFQSVRPTSAPFSNGTRLKGFKSSVVILNLPMIEIVDPM